MKKLTDLFSHSNRAVVLRKCKYIYRKNKRNIQLASAVLFAIPALAAASYWFFYNPESLSADLSKVALATKPAAQMEYGFNLNDFDFTKHQIQKNQVLSDILNAEGLNGTQIDKLAKNSQSVFSASKLRVGNNYLILRDKTSKQALHFVYEPSIYEYVVYDLKDSLDARIYKRPVSSKIKSSSGVVESSLWNAITDGGMSYQIADKMEEVLAWSIDFHHIQKQDAFKLIYEENYVDGKPAGIGKIRAAFFKHNGNDYYAFHYKTDKLDGYYDFEGRPAKKAFLKAPVQYARISSGYNLRRFHPILRRVKAHYGTDYAAPSGTPILAVADGVVTEATRKGGNGNYVKIKHDKVYETQYLHMRGFATGVRPGVQVRQGQTIGYVGSTGLATGPHVCFRFWKNGDQVNFLNEKLPNSEPMSKELLPMYFAHRDSIKTMLDGIPFQGIATPAQDTLQGVRP